MNIKFPKLHLSISDWCCIVLCSVPAFYLLSTPSIYIWDEAVYANASLDMVNGSSWWVPVEGNYNTKPPLVLWLQALLLFILPSPEWAVRLPSALSVVGILIVLAAALKRWGFDFWTRLLVFICFVGHEGFIRHHISRTGDLDAVMTFFVVVYSIVVLDAIRLKKWTSRHAMFFFATVVCAFFSKSIGGWLMLGPLLLLWFLSPIRQVLIKRRFWLGAALSLSLCLLYYFSREWLQPGFLKLVWHSEYQRMFRNVMPWHEHGASFYFKNFIYLKTFTPWIFLLMASTLYSLFFIRNREIRYQLLSWMILGFGYMMVITLPAVKLEWYDAPAYPFFALIMGVTLGYIISTVPSRWKILVLIPVLLILWRKIKFIRTDIAPRHMFEYEGAMLRQTPLSNTIKVFMPVATPEHRLQLDFYNKIRMKKTGQAAQVLENINEVKPGDQIIISQKDNLEKIQTEFEIDTLKSWGELGYTIKVLGKK